jgi:hypothetical protein
MCGRSGLWKRWNEQRGSSARHRLLAAPPGIAILSNSACGWRGPSVVVGHFGKSQVSSIPSAAVLEFQSTHFEVFAREPTSTSRHPRGHPSTLRGTGDFHAKSARSVHRSQAARQSGQARNAPATRACAIAEVPEPPEWLHEYPKQEWGRTAPELHVLGLLSSVDVACLAAYCSSYAMWRQASEAPANEGLIDTTQEGNTRRHR